MLSKIEQERNIILPDIYKDFFRRCKRSMPVNLVGTDIDNTKGELTEGAKELLEEDGVENLLDEKDFVFMMHQGYMFWYFRADGDPDPVVYGYAERELKSKAFSSLSEFCKTLR